MTLPIEFPIEPMLAKLARSMPTEQGLIFEPKWDGFRCIAFIDDDEIVLQSRNLKPLDRYFPELHLPLRQAFESRCIVDGEIVVERKDGLGLDFDALGQRIHPADSRVQMLAETTPAQFIAFDLLAVGDESLLDVGFVQRRDALTRLIRPNPTVHLTPATDDIEVARDWFVRFEGAGLDGVIAKPADGTYEPNKRSLVKVKHERTADCVVAGYRIHKDGRGVGSLLLGLYDEQGDLHSVGVCAAFTSARRTELLDELEPLTRDAVEGHPWQPWIEAQAEAAQAGKRSPGGGSRWNAGKDTSFVPLRAELVVEVTFGQLENGRFRHGVKFQRWRPDRAPTSCTFDQLEVATPVDVSALLSLSR